MKRVFVLSVISVLLLRLPVMAQDTAVTPIEPPPSTPATVPASTAAAIAAKQDAEERYKRLAADLQAVQSDNEALHAKITALEQEMQTLRAAQARPADNSGIQDELKHLADAVQEVDKKRLQDKEAISEEIRKSIGKIEQLAGSAPAPVHSTAAKSNPVPVSPAAANGYSYTIREGDRLDLILKAYNADFKSNGKKTISIRQAKEANPSVDWNRLRVGQKIVIPRPDGG